MSGRYDGAVENTSTVPDAGIPRQTDRSHVVGPAARTARPVHTAVAADEHEHAAADLVDAVIAAAGATSPDASRDLADATDTPAMTSVVEEAGTTVDVDGDVDVDVDIDIDDGAAAAPPPPAARDTPAEAATPPAGDSVSDSRAPSDPSGSAAAEAGTTEDTAEGDVPERAAASDVLALPGQRAGSERGGAPTAPVADRDGEVPGGEVPGEDRPGGDEDGASPPAAERRRRQGPRWQMTLAVAWLAGLGSLVVVGHRFLPNVDQLGSLLDTTLPWWCVPIAVLLVWALLLRTGLAIGMALIAVLAWGAVDGRALLPRGGAGTPDLRIVSQDVSIDRPDLGAIGALAASRHADVLAVQDLPSAMDAVPSAVDRTYPYHVGLYEFGVWSRFPITSTRVASFATGTGVTALRVVIDTPHGPVALYDVHLPLPSLSEKGFARQRDTALDALAATLRGEPLAHYAVVGDLDTAPTDRAMDVFGHGDLALRSAQTAAGSGFGFTWPSGLPLARLDDVLTHGMTALHASVLPPTGSSAAHRPIQADLRI